MALSGPCTFSTHSNHSNGWSSSCLKNRHFLDLVCSKHVVTTTTGISYSKKSYLKKWHFLDLVCSIHVVTITTWLSYSNRKCLKKRNFLKLISEVFNLNLKKHLLCNQVHSIQIDGKLYEITALAVRVNCTWWDIRWFSSRLKKWTCPCPCRPL